MTYKQLFVSFMLLISNLSLAAEKQLPKETTLFNQTFSWQIMGGISAFYRPTILKGVDQQKIEDILALSLLIDFYYEGFFIQSNHRRIESALQGAEVGYQLISKNDWELDLISKTYLVGYKPKKLIKDKNRNIPTLENLTDRDPGNGLALRYSRFYDDAIISVDLASLAPLSKANGWLIDLFYSHLVPYRNWDFYIGTGLTYYSQQVSDYYLGIDHDEINQVRNYYKPNSSFRAQLEIFAQHPISKKWSFNAGITQSYYSKAFDKSPLVNEHNITEVMLGVVYVF